jgi:alpha-amylase
VGVLLEGFFFRLNSGPGNFWWDHLASQAKDLGSAGFTAIWLPPPLKGNSGGFSNGYAQQTIDRIHHAPRHYS